MNIDFITSPLGEVRIKNNISFFYSDIKHCMYKVHVLVLQIFMLSYRHTIRLHALSYLPSNPSQSNNCEGLAKQFTSHILQNQDES